MDFLDSMIDMDYLDECMEILGDANYGSPEFWKKMDIFEEYLYAKFLKKEILFRRKLKCAIEMARIHAKSKCLYLECIICEKQGHLRHKSYNKIDRVMAMNRIAEHNITDRNSSCYKKALCLD